MEENTIIENPKNRVGPGMKISFLMLFGPIVLIILLVVLIGSTGKKEKNKVSKSDLTQVTSGADKDIDGKISPTILPSVYVQKVGDFIIDFSNIQCSITFTGKVSAAESTI